MFTRFILEHLLPSQSIESLTRREREILEFIAKGESLAEIAQRLSRSLKTIESHRLALGRKLNASNRVELTHIAIAEGLVPVQAVDRGQADGTDTAGLARTELSWLEQINNACVNASGATFIKKFCDAASLLPGISTAIICTPDPTLSNGANHFHRYIMGISNRGVAEDPIRFHAVGTPCEAILKHGESYFRQGVTRAFPSAKALSDLQAESYIGIQLKREDDVACGACALIGTEPLEDVGSYRKVLAFFAPRLATELETCLELDALRSRCEQLESLSEALSGEASARLNSDTKSAPLVSAVLSQIDIDIQALAGAAFLRGFTNSLCRRLGVKAASLCMYVHQSDKNMLASIMYSIDGETQENFTYSPTNMPCELAIQDGVFCLPKRAQDAFPGNQFLIEMEIEAYVGIRLVDTTGDPIGAMWVTHTDEISDAATVEHVLRHYAPRISAELAIFKQLESLLIEQEILKRQLICQNG